MAVQVNLDLQKNKEVQTMEETKENRAINETMEGDCDEFGLPKLPTGDSEKDKEIKKLRRIIKQEQGHGQWKK